MNELEKTYLQRFYEDDRMVSAVNKAFKLLIPQFLPALPPEHIPIDDKQIGERVRAYQTAIEIIDKIFSQLAIYKGSKPSLNKTDRSK